MAVVRMEEDKVFNAKLPSLTDFKRKGIDILVLNYPPKA